MPLSSAELLHPAAQPQDQHNQPRLDPGERCLTIPQIARALGVSPVKVRQWLKTGDLVGINIEQRGRGRPNWRITPSSFAAFLANRSSAPVPQEPPRA